MDLLTPFECALLAALRERDPRTVRTTTYGYPRRPRRSRWPVLTFLLLFAVWVAWTQVHPYDGPGNAGVVIGPPCHNIGYEWRGVPGFFFNSCS